MTKLHLYIKTLIVFCSVFMLSCNSFYFKRNIYVPVKAKNLKMEYSSVKELDSLKNIKKSEYSRAKFIDTILDRNQIIVDKINEMNDSNDIREENTLIKFDKKLYTLQEINKGKYVRAYFNRDVNNNFTAYKRKEVSLTEMILYGIGVTIFTAIVAAVVSFIILAVLLLAFLYSFEHEQ